MTDDAQRAEQAAREVNWVSQGAQRLIDHCRNTARTSPTHTPAGRKLMRLCHERLTANLVAHVAAAEALPRGPMTDTIAPVVMMLSGRGDDVTMGAEHVAAVVVHAAVISSAYYAMNTRDIKPQTAVNRAHEIGEALEHDIRFRAWAKDQKSDAEKHAVKRIKEQMKCSPQAWKRRALKMREIADETWTHEQSVSLGMDLLHALTVAAPDVFSTKVIRHGSKSVRIMVMSQEATESLSSAHDFAAIAQPKLGMTIIKPVHWSRGGTTDVT